MAAGRLLALSVIDLEVSRGPITPDDMDIAGQIDGDSRFPGFARIPGEPFCRRPGASMSIGFSIIDLKVPCRVVVPDQMKIVVGVDRQGGMKGRAGSPSEPFAGWPGPS